MSLSSSNGSGSLGQDGKAPLPGNERLEVRPGGLLVQRRCSENGLGSKEFRLRIVFGNAWYEITINSLATVGDLKKVLSSETGLQPTEQTLVFKGKERNNNADYLDAIGVNDRSKIVLAEDPMSKERRYVEMWKNAKIQSARRAISHISMEIDNLAEQVVKIEKSVTSGKMVSEVQITTLTELLMNQAVKLETVAAQGETAPEKKLQAKRVQKLVESLDMLKVSNSRLKSVVVTTKWETFGSPIRTPVSTKWELFD